jgi:transcription elongation factor Elf1
MSKLEKLIREAKESCERRGHKMRRFEHSKPFNDIMHGHATSECKICGKVVHVNSRPLSNEINIYGEAVALSCED